MAGLFIYFVGCLLVKGALRYSWDARLRGIITIDSEPRSQARVERLLIFLKDPNLIFIKSRKTAGTSIEIALSMSANSRFHP